MLQIKVVGFEGLEIILSYSMSVMNFNNTSNQSKQGGASFMPYMLNTNKV